MGYEVVISQCHSSYIILDLVFGFNLVDIFIYFGYYNLLLFSSYKDTKKIQIWNVCMNYLL